MRKLGTESIGRRQICASFGTENHRCPLAIKGPLQVTGILQSPLGNLQTEQLRGFDRAHGVGWNAEFEWIEFCFIDETAPLGNGFASILTFWIIEGCGLPSALGDFLNQISPSENI